MLNSGRSLTLARSLLFACVLLVPMACDDGGGSEQPEDTLLDTSGDTAADASPDTVGDTSTTPDLSTVDCVDLVPLRAWETDPSAVAILFAAADCETREPVAGLDDPALYLIAEDGEPVSSEAYRNVLPSDGQRVYVSLLLDISDSTLGVRSTIVGSAQAFVQELLSRPSFADRVYIGVRLFDGRAELIDWQLPTGDAGTLLARLDALTSYSDPLADGGSTNLNGAFLQGVASLQTHQQRIIDVNLEGIVTTGYTLVFTDGGDSAGRVVATMAAATVAQARSTELVDPNPVVQTYAVALTEGEDYALLGGREALLELVGDDGCASNHDDVAACRFLTEAEDAAALQQSFRDVANQIAAQIEGTYLLAYCSSKRSGTPEVTLHIDPSVVASGTGIGYRFDASGFAGGCNQQFFETACDVPQCGGFNCGACDEQVASCDPTTLRCVDNCIAQGLCEGEPITNAFGYSQTCGGGDSIAKCDGVCIDVSADDANCGGCGVTCSAAGSSCVAGQCVCPGGGIECGGVCIDASADTQNCGACGNVCPTSASCSAGECVCPDGGLSCDDVCIDPMTDGQNCGGCGVDCGIGGSCQAGLCVCESGLLACSDICVDLQTHPRNCGTCGNACASNERCAVGQCNRTPQVSAGADHTCGVKIDGSIVCWGSDIDGQSTPPAGSFVQVSAGSEHTCGIQTDGTVVCWGSNSSGESTPLAGSFVQVSAGRNLTCGVKTDGTAVCWGEDQFGQSTPPAGSFVQGSAGQNHTCGVKTDDTVVCWGSDTYFQSTPPTDSFVQVSAGDRHTCGVRTDDTVVCWGYDGYGQSTPPAGAFVQVSAGWYHTCGVKTDGTVVCWGSDHEGVSTPPAGSFVQVSAGRDHTCGVKTDDTVVCWGYDGYGQSTPPAGL